MAYTGNPLFSGLSAFKADKPTGRPTAAGKTWFSDILQKKLPTTDRPHMTSYTKYGSAISSRAAPIPYGQRTTFEPATGIPKPTMGEFPEYMMPEIDRGRISELQELSMGAPMGKLRRGLSETALGARSIENPMVRAQMMRSLMSGYGTGISDIRAGAGREAMGMYMPEFQAAGQKAAAEYQTGVGGVQAQFQADLADYMRRGSQITTPVQGRYEGSTRKPIRWG